MKNARYYAVKALLRSLEGGYSQIILNKVLEESDLSSSDRAFTSSIFYGVLERKIPLERIIKERCKKKPDKEVYAILLTAFYQLLFMPKIPQSAVCNESVKLSKEFKKTSAGSFINGTLRGFIREGCPYPQGKNEKERLSLSYSCSMDIAESFISWLGFEKAEEALKNSLGKAPVYIRTNILNATDEELILSLKKDKIEVEKEDIPHTFKVKEGDIAHTKAFKKGLFTVSDKMSQICALSVKAKKGEKILDLCSAPGTKAFIMAEEMENEGKIISCDISEGRLKLIDEGKERLGINIIETMPNDASKINEKLLNEKFDRILCDVPCSGLGVIRRKPELKYRSKEDYENIHILQYEILENASKYLKDGGTIIYSTCTVNPLENEENIKKFLKEHPDFKEKAIGEGSVIKNNVGENGSDGFFIAGLEKLADGNRKG